MGNAYQVIFFDLEKVIYRDFMNGYEIEISGLNGKKRDKTARIYLWHNRSTIVNQVSVHPVTPKALQNAILSMLKGVGEMS